MEATSPIMMACGVSEAEPLVGKWLLRVQETDYSFGGVREQPVSRTRRADTLCASEWSPRGQRVDGSHRALSCRCAGRMDNLLNAES